MKQHEELRNMYSSPSIIRMIKSRRMRWPGHVACMAEKRNVWKVLVGKPEGKRPPGRRRHRQENIKTDHREIGWVAWTGLIRLSIGTSGGLL
jgi:hypothetical protein